MVTVTFGVSAKTFSTCNEATCSIAQEEAFHRIQDRKARAR